MVVMKQSPRGGTVPRRGRPRVLLLIKCMGHGGAEQLIVNVCAHRDRDAFDYEVAYVLASQDSLVPFLAATGVPVHALGARGDGDLRWMLALRRLLVAGDFDLVHFHLPYSSALGRLVVLSLPRRRRPVLLSTVHNIWAETPLVVRALNRSTSALDKGVIAVSRSVDMALPKELRRRSNVVVHGMDLTGPAELLARKESVRREVRAELGVAAHEILVLTVANFRAQKGYDVLLEAARLVGAAGAPVRFAAVGWGPQRDEMAALHRSLELGDRFLFLGQRTDALRLMVGSDVFVLASHYEGLPVVLMEATSVGLPIVTTAVGEVPNILTDDVDAVIVPPGEPKMLASAVERLAADEGLRHRLGASALVRSEMFDVTRSVARIEALYTELLAGVPVSPPVRP
jgi:glycosyltransferase involved in cell wall biosynthesis